MAHSKPMAEGHSLDNTPVDDVGVDLAAVAQSSQPFIGDWSRLISQTNWEKGRIVCEWRRNLQSQGLPASACADETWSRLVGGVSPQHVGRLRRTFERFGQVWSSYRGLYWSHFYAALDWNDAEMWLEGAVQNNWSVSQMRVSRWQTLGAAPDQIPREAEIVVVEADEETEALAAGVGGALPASGEFQSGPRPEGPDFGDEDRGLADAATAVPFAVQEDEDLAAPSPAPSARWFEEFVDLPDDLAHAVEQMKLAIIRLKLGEWREISCEKLDRILAALSRLANS